MFIWHLNVIGFAVCSTCSRKQIFLANTLFKCVCYGAKGIHILTSGTDRKVAFWDKTDGILLRELEGSKGAINAMDISCDGTIYVTGGEQKLLKVLHLKPFT